VPAFDLEEIEGDDDGEFVVDCVTHETGHLRYLKLVS
jgi:hypothetical protein